jgi:poly-gamma-glutamate capsule biosynthesis protein CapA/YwtB (metallophosphatase superfamily)
MNLKLFACGDVLNFKAKEDFIDRNLTEIIRNSDITICNFEAPIYHENMESINKVGPHVYQSFESIKHLKYAGFDYVSLANNHIYDYKQKSLETTLNEFNKNQINYLGGGVNFEDAYSTKILKQNVIKIGLLAGCKNEFGCLFEDQKRGGYAWIFHHKIEDNIRELKETCDFVVMITHSGVENIKFPIKE